ncbi:MAG: hypothetical protein U1E66_08735 [Rhodospirillales bacterium]
MRPIHLFRAGTHVASDGTPIAFSDADVRAIADRYDRGLHEAPIVIGHPKTDSPAYGWVANLTFADGSLLATPRQVDPGFAELVRAGRFKKISAAFYPPYATSNPKPGSFYLRHLGFLGAQPPAVKGLQSVELSAGDHGAVTFELAAADVPSAAFAEEVPMSNFPFPVQPDSTAISIAYRNKRYIADAVLQRIPVARMEFTYSRHDLSQGFTVPSTFVGRRGRPNEITFDATEEKGVTLDYALDDPVPGVDMDNAPKNYNPIDHAVMMMTDLILLDREMRVAGKVFDDDNYATGNKVQLTGTNRWSDYTNSDPISDIEAGIEKLVIRPNTLVFGRKTFDVLKRHPKLIKALHGPLSDDGFAKRQQLAELFELDAVLVGESWLNTARQGQAPLLQQVWGPHAALLWLDPQLRAAKGAATYGFTAQYGDRVAGSSPDKDIGFRGGFRVRVGESVAEVIACKDLGYFIQDAVA